MGITRDYTNIDRYLNELLGDIYNQPMDDGHVEMFHHVLDNWIPKLVPCNNVLDVGCGQGDAQEWFEELGVEYTGVTLGNDYLVASRNHRNVYKQDFSFLSYPDNSFDLVFSRHSLEHSFSPILSLMEWHRVSRAYLCLILPQPRAFGWKGRNHYSVMSEKHAVFLLNRAGWGVVWKDHEDEREYRFMAQKAERMNYEDADAYIDHEKEEA